MQRRTLFGMICLFSALFASGCGKEEPKPVLAVRQPNPDDVPPVNVDVPIPVLTAQQRFDVAIANAFCLLAEKKDEAALARLQEAQTLIDSDFVKGEIARLTARQARAAAADRIARDIQTVLNAGQAAEAGRLSVDALREFGDGDAAGRLTTLKRQADALIAAQAADQANKQKFLTDAETARQAKNFRAALLAYDQAAASGVEVTTYKVTYDDLRDRMSRYDERRGRAAELRRDASKLEEALAVLDEARKAWDTQQIAEEMEECRLAISTRRDRLAIADFEVVGDVGMPLAGRTIAEEILPHFKGRFDVVERSQVGALVQELKLEAADLQVNEAGRSELGRLAKARYLVVGSVSRLYGVSVNARLVDVQSGLVVQTAKIVAATPREMSSKLPALARILQMSDEQKITYEQELAQAVTIDTPPPPTPPQPAPWAPPAPPAAQGDVRPMIVFDPRPPEFGQVAFEDFNRIPASVDQPQVVVGDVINPWRSRAFAVAIELGDNLFLRGLFVDAMRYYQFALSLWPGQADVMLRVNQCLPFLPPSVVVAQVRPRLAVLPFVEIGNPGFLPPGTGMWVAGSIAPYFGNSYDIVDSGEVRWWMGRLGLTYRDVLVEPSARLLLARAMGARYFLVGNLRETSSFDASAQIVDAEFNALVGVGSIHVSSPWELKMRLPELAQTTLLPPAQRALVVQQNIVTSQRVQEAQISIGKGNFRFAIGLYRVILLNQPNNCQARYALLEAERRQRQYDLEQARLAAYQQQQAAYLADQQRQAALAAAAQQQAGLQVEVDVQLFGRHKQQAHIQLLAQARNAASNNQFAVAINLCESAAALNRSPEASNELAQLRAQAAEAERLRIAQDQAARNAALAQQRDIDLLAARNALAAAQQQRLQAEQQRRQVDEARNKAAYDRLLDQAQTARANGQFDVAISALQTARTLKPSAEVDQLVSAALIDQARANADKKGAEERRKLEAELAAEQARRRQAEQQAAVNQAKYAEAIQQARTALDNKKYDLARQQFQIAALNQRTDEAVAGMRQADDALAKAQAAAEASRIARLQEQKQKEQEQTHDAEAQKQKFLVLIATARQAITSRQFDAAEKSWNDARALNGTDPLVAQVRKEISDGRAGMASAEASKRYLDAITSAKTALASAHYDDAIAAAQVALRQMPNDAAASQLVAQAGKAKTDAQNALVEAERRKNYESVMTQARAAMQARQFAQASDLYTSALKVAPNDPTARQGLNDARLALNPPKKELPVVEPPKVDPVQTAYNQNIGAARNAFAQQNYGMATRFAAEALKLKPNDAEAVKIINDSRLALTPPKKEIPKAEPPPKKEPPRVEPAAQLNQWLQAAANEEAQGKYAEASNSYREAQKLAPNNGEIKKRAAFCQDMSSGQHELGAGHFGEASNAFDQALKLYPGDAAAKHFAQMAKEKKKN